MNDFNSFIKMRVGFGYSEHGMKYAKSYALFIFNNYTEEEEVTEEMLTKYLSLHPHENHNTYSNIIGEIRTFSNYLVSIGKKAFVPDKTYTYSKKRTHYIPYLLNDEELSLFFNHLDSYDDNDLFERNDNKKFVFPVMYRMMYCCGLRPQEVVNLKMEDVDLKTGEIYVRETKSYRDRHIVMSSDMLHLCQQYMNYYISDNCTYFFEKQNGSKYTHDDLHYCIYHFKKKTGFNKPNFRSYCFRHMFATQNIINWINNDEDINLLFPYLRVYMGHSKLDYTLYYIHLLPEHLRKKAAIDTNAYDFIYPEIESSEI